jgi:hypothetical protein
MPLPSAKNTVSVLFLFISAINGRGGGRVYSILYCPVGEESSDLFFRKHIAVDLKDLNNKPV